MKILNQLKDTYLMGSVRRVCEYNNGLIIQGKVLGEKYIVPLIITLKATIAVSR
jgi:hypothetical protein